MTQWKEKQHDVETQFKRLCRPMQSNKGQKVKGKKSKKVDYTNRTKLLRRLIDKGIFHQG